MACRVNCERVNWSSEHLYHTNSFKKAQRVFKPQSIFTLEATLDLTIRHSLLPSQWPSLVYGIFV